MTSGADSKRSIFDRLMPLVRPKLLRDFAPPPSKIDAGLWVLDRCMQMPGGAILPTRATLISLPGGSLLVIAPPAVEAGGLELVDQLGTVRHVLVPNAFHYMNAAGFLDRYPRAAFWAAPGLFARVAGLPRGKELTETAPDPWHDVIDQAVVAPTSEVSEVALFHRPSATLILTDVAFHMVRFERTFDRIAWRLSGVPAGFGPSRTSRLMLLRDRPLAAAFLEKIRAWPFRRIVVAHGDTVETDAAAVFARAFASYLPKTAGEDRGRAKTAG